MRPNTRKPVKVLPAVIRTGRAIVLMHQNTNSALVHGQDLMVIYSVVNSGGDVNITASFYLGDTHPRGHQDVQRQTTSDSVQMFNSIL